MYTMLLVLKLFEYNLIYAPTKITDNNMYLIFVCCTIILNLIYYQLLHYKTITNYFKFNLLPDHDKAKLSTLVWPSSLIGRHAAS